MTRVNRPDEAVLASGGDIFGGVVDEHVVEARLHHQVAVEIEVQFRFDDRVTKQDRLVHTTTQHQQLPVALGKLD